MIAIGRSLDPGQTQRRCDDGRCGFRRCSRCCDQQGWVLFRAALPTPAWLLRSSRGWPVSLLVYLLIRDQS